MSRNKSDEDFARMVLYFWRQKGDPTRYIEWDPIRCAAIMPEFFEAWFKYKIYEGLANMAAATHEGIDHD